MKVKIHIRDPFTRHQIDCTKEPQICQIYVTYVLSNAYTFDLFSSELALFIFSNVVA